MSLAPHIDHRGRFAAVARSLGATRNVASTCERLLERYAEPHRIHHGFRKLEFGLDRIDECAQQLEEPAIVELAWWFRNAVFAAHPLALNEERSAVLAWNACREMGMPVVTGERIRKMARATRTPWVDESVLEDEDPSTAALVDIDLSVFGCDPLTFAIRERDVKAECGVLQQISRALLRALPLRRLLARDVIYRCPFIRERYESQARQNLARLAHDLRNAPHDGLGIGATDTNVFTTRYGALETLFTWEQLVKVTSLTPEGMPTRLVLDFGCSADVPSVRLDDPHARDVVDRLRSIRGYRRGLERSSGVELVFSSPMSGKPTTPLVPRRDEQIYR